MNHFNSSPFYKAMGHDGRRNLALTLLNHDKEGLTYADLQFELGLTYQALRQLVDYGRALFETKRERGDKGFEDSQIRLKDDVRELLACMRAHGFLPSREVPKDEPTSTYEVYYRPEPTEYADQRVQEVFVSFEVPDCYTDQEVRWRCREELDTLLESTFYPGWRKRGGD